MTRTQEEIDAKGKDNARITVMRDGKVIIKNGKAVSENKEAK
jgi:hypothetical protein